MDLVDSSSFRTHQEGPEFPQVLPKGPVRFLGVTPNEENGEERTASRGRGRPQRVQEPAPVEEIIEEAPLPTTRRRPIAALSTEVIIALCSFEMMILHFNNDCTTEFSGKFQFFQLIVEIY